MKEKISRKRQAKFYLSHEAVSLLAAESERSTYSMSTLVDILIKENYGEAKAAPEKIGGYVTPEALERVTHAIAPPRKQEPEKATGDFRGDF